MASAVGRIREFNAWLIWRAKLRVLRHPKVVAIRQRRHALFREILNVQPTDTIIDVGAGPGAALARFNHDNRITATDIRPQAYTQPNVTFLQADAAHLPFPDRSFDIAFSNSLIEHMQPEARRAAAAEIRRVADRYFVQTPNKWFPLEPHYMLPLFQFFPARLRHYYDRRFHNDWIELLTCRELRDLFPDAQIHRERMFGITRSLIAYRG